MAAALTCSFDPKDPHLSVRTGATSRRNLYHGFGRIGGMTLGTDLLNLRRNRTSSVLTLMSGIERLATARSETAIMMRAFSLNELGDAVLANVAVYALEAYWGDAPLLPARRATATRRRKTRRIDTSHLYQRRLFA